MVRGPELRESIENGRFHAECFDMITIPHVDEPCHDLLGIVNDLREGSMIEKHLRIHEVSSLTGYSIATIRKKVLRREIGFRKVNRIISIPESEVVRLLGTFQPAVSLK